MNRRGSNGSSKGRRQSKTYEPPFDADMEARVKVLTVIRDYPGCGVWDLPLHLDMAEADVQRIVKQLLSPFDGLALVECFAGRLYEIRRG